MSAKRKLSLSMPQPAKKERKAIDIDRKMKVIKQYEGGKKVNVIARDTKLSHSTLSTILKDKERIREAIKGSTPMRSTVITNQRSGPIHEMEKLLYIWMENQIQKRTPLNLFTVQMKVRSLFQTLKECVEEDYSQEFVASTGWFQRFKKRFQMHSVRVTGEAASADEEGARKFVDSLDELITEIYEEKKKHTIQTKLTMFMKKSTPVTPTAASDDDINNPQPSISGR
ncbi:putative CENPB DNA-binding domain-containing protein 1 [Saccopteryx leptura]|uniref:putative CENPB DNA-binding domain-containing protein 1 n=1 Tax=Saccopteryx leptura TaxID=249018 RepID=UPI00339C811D